MNYVCGVCGEQFEPTSAQLRHKQWTCKLCRSEKSKAWYVVNKDRVRAVSKRWRAAHTEEHRAYAKKWCAAHPEECKAAHQKYRAEHLEERKAYDKKYRVDHFKERGASAKKYRAAHPDRISARRKVYAATKAGILLRLPRENCGAAKVEGHHEDYTQPLMVTWLCLTCHAQLHACKKAGAGVP